MGTIKVGQQYSTPDGKIVEITGVVINNLSKFFVSVSGIRGTMKIKEIDKCKLITNGANSTSST